jgi:hypothetical protein
MFIIITTAIALALFILVSLSLPSIQKRQYTVVKPRKQQSTVFNKGDTARRLRTTGKIHA